ncbi:MAG: threonine/serine exporter family protein [Clostridia bacterium]|nr:threonine/serine exporter family protein [Clostridia bacterium]MBQ6526213.1 threonine/serine exporter family protein [Clostridia bacterium]MBQ6784291.1 threonine/serine exporter family protein [Clostridia bacterium]
MPVPWHNMVEDSASHVPATEATLKEKTTLAARIGLLTLSVGASAWRVRRSLNIVSRSLGMACAADIGLLTLELTCFDEGDSYSEAFSLRTAGVNTDKLDAVEKLVAEFEETCQTTSVSEYHHMLDDLEKKPANYNAWKLGLAAAFACGAFTFLLGGGIPEVLCAFLGAGVGQFIRSKMLGKRITLIACIIVSVMAACLTYVGTISLAEAILDISSIHEAGYICAMLFIIPGFPLITGGIDLAKLDMRSGLERLAYALFIIVIATLTGYAMALLLHFQPASFAELSISPLWNLLLRLLASFIGVYGFSMMFNSPPKMAAIAGLVGMVANTLRLELLDLTTIPAGIAALIGATTAGILASLVFREVGYPRVSLTVPSIVIMVPGLFLYRGIYYLGLDNVGDASLWLTKALFIIMALPLGLVVARVLTDSYFRHSS